eukprot:4624801-Pyramimonas_sp.AAC.1
MFAARCNSRCFDEQDIYFVSGITAGQLNPPELYYNYDALVRMRPDLTELTESKVVWLALIYDPYRYNDLDGPWYRLVPPGSEVPARLLVKKEAVRAVAERDLPVEFSA